MRGNGVAAEGARAEVQDTRGGDLGLRAEDGQIRTADLQDQEQVRPGETADSVRVRPRQQGEEAQPH